MINKVYKYFNCHFVLSGATDEDKATGKVTVNIAEVKPSGEFSTSAGASFETGPLASLGPGMSGRIQKAFLEAGEGDVCAVGDSKACFRVLIVNEDDSATIIGHSGVEWVREEALAVVDKVG